VALSPFSDPYSVPVSVLCVSVCAGRFAPVALGCTSILMFPTNCTYHDDSCNSENGFVICYFFCQNAN
jgi:hypothetical protein